ncbi:LysR family transcriptional regulator [Pseudonocardia nigra]|uniref:LysR family transcriptional regulator n=1 Tax=Pseudonocardia nigra TaxID=1921578 RepID=UPI001C5D4E20|nr:LysR family transcriptional regulator [Pseudonocardia nigra]
MTVELRHLRALVAIAEEGNLTRAAARLHLTQPALSRTLQQLEAHLRIRLVDRSTHHLELTPAGLVFRDRARAALTAVDAALDPDQAATWPLRLGHSWSALGPHTTTLLRRWRQDHPDVPLELLRIDDRSAGLGQGSVDVAVVRERLAIRGVHTERLLAEPRVAAVPADGPLAERATLTLADLAEHPVALNTVSGTTTLDLWPSGARPRATVAVANTDDWLAAIAAGRAVGVTTSATTEIHPHPAVAYRPLADAPAVDVHLAWREPPSHPAVGALLDLVHAVVPAEGPGIVGAGG